MTGKKKVAKSWFVELGVTHPRLRLWPQRWARGKCGLKMGMFSEKQTQPDTSSTSRL